MHEAVKDADLVIEAVPEIPDLKHKIFADLGAMTKEDCILGTNTLHYQSPILLLHPVGQRKS